jgi:hypothetical protein
VAAAPATGAGAPRLSIRRRSSSIWRAISAARSRSSRPSFGARPARPHHRRQQGGEVEGPHHAIHQGPLAAVGGPDAALVDHRQHDGALGGAVAGAERVDEVVAPRRGGPEATRAGLAAGCRHGERGRRHRWGGEAEAAVEQLVEQRPVLVVLDQTGGQRLPQQRAVEEVEVA